MGILKSDTKYVLKSKKTGLYYSSKKGWVHYTSLASSFGYYNLIKFFVKWYVNYKYEPVRFSKILYLKAGFDVNV